MMTESSSHHTRSSNHPSNHRNWRRSIGNLLLAVGMVLLLAAMFARVKIILAADLQSNKRFLVSDVDPLVVLPQIPDANLFFEPLDSQNPNTAILDKPAPEPAFTIDVPPLGQPNLTVDKPPKPIAQIAQPESSMLFLPVVQASTIDETEPIDEKAGIPAIKPDPNPGSGPVIRIVIPSLNIDRAVIEVGLKKDSGKKLTWNTDVLFSTNNRPDLVGQASTSVNPGEGGNIILIGHNYNNGWYSPAGVFVNLSKLKPGSQILVYTRDGSEFLYKVRQVKKVPWQQQNGVELEKHHKFLWPTENEQLTLVTCGGANFGVWSARIYVVAVPSEVKKAQ